MLNILFMGTPDFAKESLEAIYNKGHNILGVVTNPDRPKGRGMKMIASPVKEFALEKNLPVYQPEKVKNNQEFLEIIKSLNPDMVCVVAYGKVLPIEILNIPKFGSINVHGSLLPKYRGSAPIQWAVINGEQKTGVTTVYMSEGLDSGDMILKKEVEIGQDETTGELWNRLSKIGAQLLVETIEQIERGNAPRIPQGNDFTLAPMLNKEMSKIDWNTKKGLEIKNLIRGLNPIMGTYTFYDNKKIKIWKADNLSFENFETQNNIQKCCEKRNGEIVLSDDKKGLYIKCLDGIIKVIEIQGENSKRMNISDFLRGNKLEVGKVFE